MHASARPAGTGPVRLNPSTEPVCSTTPPQPHCQHQPGWTQVARAVAPYDIGPVRATPSSPPMSERVIRFSHCRCRCGFSAFKLRVAISSEPSYTARWRKLKEKSRLAAPRIRRKTKTIVPSCCGDISASQPQKPAMVKMGRGIAGAEHSPGKEGLGGRKARPPSSSVSEDSEKPKVHITVALVRRGFDLHSDTRRLVPVQGTMTFTEFRALVCRTLGLGLGDTYPLRLTVLGAVSPIHGGILMGTLFEEAMSDSDSDGLLYVQH